MSDYKLLIDGKLVSGAMALNVVNPATEGKWLPRRPGQIARQLDQAIARGQSGLSAVVGDAGAGPRCVAGQAG